MEESCSLVCHTSSSLSLVVERKHGHNWESKLAAKFALTLQLRKVLIVYICARLMYTNVQHLWKTSSVKTMQLNQKRFQICSSTCAWQECRSRYTKIHCAALTCFPLALFFCIQLCDNACIKDQKHVILISILLHSTRPFSLTTDFFLQHVNRDSHYVVLILLYINCITCFCV